MKTRLLASLLLLGSPLLACDSTGTIASTIRVVAIRTVAHAATQRKAPAARPVLSFSNSTSSFGKSSPVPVVSAPPARPAPPPARPAQPPPLPAHLFM